MSSWYLFRRAATTSVSCCPGIQCMLAYITSSSCFLFMWFCLSFCLSSLVFHIDYLFIIQMPFPAIFVLAFPGQFFFAFLLSCAHSSLFFTSSTPSTRQQFFWFSCSRFPASRAANAALYATTNYYCVLTYLNPSLLLFLSPLPGPHSRALF